MISVEDFERKYLIHKLEANEVVKEFDCSDADLNDFILNDATNYRNSLLAVTYVLSTKENPKKVLGFCSLAHDNVSINDFDSKSAFKHFRKKQGIHSSQYMSSYPAIKVCRIGVDQSAKNQRIGTTLLNYVKTNFVVDPNAGCRFVTVDAYRNAVPFYEKNGFFVLKKQDDETKSTRPLYFDLNDIGR